MAELYAAHPMWIWLIVAGVLLALEVATGSGWLLWPAACAAVTGLLTLAHAPVGMVGEIAFFAILTIVTTLFARRFIPDGRLRPGPDINDRSNALVGKRGTVVQAFSNGAGRVLVDGAEWDAEADAGVTPGDLVEVVSVLGGARLRVRPA